MKKLILASLTIVALSATSVSFASTPKATATGTGAMYQLNQQRKEEIKTNKTQMTSEITAIKNQAKANRAEIEANKNNFRASLNIARKYVIKAATGTNRIAIATIIKTKEDDMKELQTNTNALIKSGTVDRSGYIATASNIITIFRTDLLPYIASGQQAAFDRFIQERINLMITNVGIRQTNKNLRMQIGNKRVTFKTRLEGKKTEYKDAIATIKASRKTK